LHFQSTFNAHQSECMNDATKLILKRPLNTVNWRHHLSYIRPPCKILAKNSCSFDPGPKFKRRISGAPKNFGLAKSNCSKDEDHDSVWLTGRAACELPMGFGQPGRRTGFTGHALRVVEAWWLHRRDHRSCHPSLCRCSCRYDRGGPRGGVAAAPGRRQSVPLWHCLQ